ncbi:alpha-D-ribose 1-methylphosphonate 5-triphosphate synthase subunit PhnI [Rhodococcus wratislaviensis]|uniref:Bacterial phosphonate metabolism protein (PhnI) n=3 Tax=Rhodococcus TaxID=1827 RepID=A0AB38FPB7_RHOWR|nr:MULTISPECIES: carbon-phosphorus lyase complex subunit PhnI [Rhodococcus]AII07678.1 phosphonate metabolism protein PhnI [Rhodococcus opacus]REE75742.1 alpha-D-ribose 1-methylphosphonate 5-triphosphate synthase subunit PhnI [Rhodococcus wratislaviensis]GAF44398.1 PhnI family protein [Rhodococcus wratislaviensis NBRC 100605]SPZ43445.1 Bacterial phosphonate metabolism protein (PhnI) [Rhodococcus wratislaviensis]
MGYSGARGGLDAILAAESLVRGARNTDPAPWLTTEQITGRMRLAVDRVMGEGGLYDEDTAADALRQAEGDVIEATHLVRAHQSTLPRLAVSEPIDPDEMVVLRRIVPAHRTPDGPQLLGRTSDYTGRMLDRDAQPGPVIVPESLPAETERGEDQRHPRRFSDMLREMDLLVDNRPADAAPTAAPFDISRHPARPPAPRSAILASMARAETGSLIGTWYRSIRGTEGNIHEVTLGEVRHGRLPLRVVHPHTGKPVLLGHIRASECEAIEDLDGPDEDRSRFDVGYGLCFGHNERKAIAMANLDIACRRFGDADGLEQVLLLTTDGLDSCGFLEHLKLPHYVTFRSMIDRKRAVRGVESVAERTAEPIGRTC